MDTLIFSFLGFLITVCFTVTILHESIFVSIFFLIALFSFFSLFLILSGFEFVGFVYLIVYVGAVAVLFLFMIMLFDKSEYLFFSRRSNQFSLIFFFYFLLVFFFSFLFFSMCYYIPFYPLNSLFLNSFIKDIHISLFNFSGSNTELIGFSIYNFFVIHLMAASLVLLLGMLGAIILTQSVFWGISTYKHQDIKEQILRKRFFYKI